MFGAMRAAASGISTQQGFAYGELVAYNPSSHTGQFVLPAHPDPVTGEPTSTGFIQLGTPHVGDNGSGAQFPPKIGAQAIIMFIDERRQFPVFSQWYFNKVDPAPFPAGGQWGWTDPNGSTVSTTNDGGTPGDGVGAVKSIGKGYHETGTATGQITVHNSATQEIASLAAYVNLGALGSAMTSANAALNNGHITTFESSLFSARLADLTALVTAMVAAGVPSAGSILSHLATLAHIPVSGLGSGTVNIKT